MKIDANQILREQGASALRGIMDAARPFNDHDVTGEAPATQTKPAGIDAPGLAWRPRKGGWAAVWIARQDIAKKGFKPATHQIGVFTSELTDDDQIKIRSECERLQREVLSWARMSKPNREANGMPSATSTFDPAPYAFPN